MCWRCDLSVRLDDRLEWSAWRGCVWTSHFMIEPWIPGSVELALFSPVFFLWSGPIWMPSFFILPSPLLVHSMMGTLLLCDFMTSIFSHFSRHTKNLETQHQITPNSPKMKKKNTVDSSGTSSCQYSSSQFVNGDKFLCRIWPNLQQEFFKLKTVSFLPEL